MKKLTIYRNGEAELHNDFLLRDSAYRIYARTKELSKKEGTACIILTSHVPRARYTAQLIQMAMPKIRISETAFLSHYYAGCPRKFIKSFANSLPLHAEHAILVSHRMNISDLADCYIPRGGSVTLEAERWEDMFTSKVCSRRINESPVDEKTSEEILSECGFLQGEKEMLKACSFIVD